MSRSVSFVIPVLNESGRIASLLDHLTARFPDAQLVVVDGGSSDDTVAQAMPRCSQLLLSNPGRALQMNLGAEVASGDYLLFLHADSHPEFDGPALQRELSDSPAWGFCPIRLRGAGWSLRLIGYCMNLRSRLTRVATGDQMLFLRRELFEESGGFDAIPLMEDGAFCKRLRRLAPPHIVSQPVTTSSRRWRERGVWRTVLQMWWLRLAYVVGVSPRRLWQHYYGR